MSNENRRLSLSVLGSFVRFFTFLIPEKEAKRGKYLGFSSFPAYECSFLQRIFIHAYLFIRFCLLLLRKLVKIVHKTLVFCGNSLLGTEKIS